MLSRQHNDCITEELGFVSWQDQEICRLWNVITGPRYSLFFVGTGGLFSGLGRKWVDGPPPPPHSHLPLWRLQGQIKNQVLGQCSVKDSTLILVIHMYENG
jgi:hypothetical protein